MKFSSTVITKHNPVRSVSFQEEPLILREAPQTPSKSKIAAKCMPKGVAERQVCHCVVFFDVSILYF